MEAATGEAGERNILLAKKVREKEGKVLSLRALWIPQALQFLVWIPARILLKFFVSFQIFGEEHLEAVEKLKRGGHVNGVIFVANHASELDPIVVRAAMRSISKLTPMHYVARVRDYYHDKKFLEKYLYGGAFFRWWGAYPAYSGMKDYRQSLENHIELLKRGRSVLIFPEGKRTKNGELGSARGGTAFLSYELGCPIVPVGISGTYRLGWKNFFLRRNKVRVVYGELCYPKDLFKRTHPKTEPTPGQYRDVAQYILLKTQKMVETFRH